MEITKITQFFAENVSASASAVNDNLASSISSSVSGGFKSLLSAITIPVIIALVVFILSGAVLLAKKFMRISKTDPENYKMEIKKLYWYIGGIMALFFSLIFFIVMQSNNWSILADYTPKAL
ncbi:hypothetical protein H9M94_03125 [Mycoplasma sp. Pen4]|uniref:hypothetical protein n=1 Tax=Mycoplasma sp. Pen4 TaxID=640330 RepID=UPI00165494B2|nr:hypothetical protein [Mycoplasma sp. Pen4]QNM93319.1 hypothetical protein H9M94_01660 [Mycoplasma sp. Pen4]QNM93466.1 hypothetical protein H9M94_02545 [Mycoplasma sp. Pen4]QNM93514.1 hypothetical protein H9M94_02795 [Mycoplasma sp. Pen4]QNM93572.1 hypothetical protein H9M94_03125 [Mycoplasma sp. Pen4]